MHKSSCVVLLAMVLFSHAGAARAADAKTCDTYVKEATAKAQGIRQFNCGFDVNDPRWSSERGSHAAWCKDADKDAVEREIARRRGEMKLCQTCRTYAELATGAAADNLKFRCKLEGPRWSGKMGDHFGWCIQQYEPVGADEKNVAGASKAALAKMEGSVNIETGRRAREVTACKSQTVKSRNRPG